MKIEDQVCSLELAKKLKELGVIQESYFIHAGNRGVIPRFDTDIIRKTSLWDDVEKLIFAAFSVAELLDIFPDHTEPHRWHFGMERKELREQCGGKYYCVTDARDYPHDDDFYSDNPADCLANAIIMLIESKFIEAQK